MTGETNTRITRAVFAVGGAALTARGVLIALDTIRPAQWPEILIWFAAGIVAHDAVIAPLTLLLGRVVRPGPVIATGWMAVGVVLMLSYPLLKGADRRQNPTVIPEAPTVGLLRALAVVMLGMVLAWGIRRLRRLRAPTPGG